MAEMVSGDVARPVAAPAWRQRRWLLLTVVAVLVALLGLLFWALRANPGAPVGGAIPLTGPAPDFTVTTLDGQRVTLSALRGHPVVINFWASWCVPCQQEAPELRQAYQALQPSGVVFVGLVWNDTESEAAKFVRDYGVSYPSALDQGGRIAVDYGITGVPETFLIDRDGRLTQKWVGPITAARLRAMVEPLTR